MPKYLNNYLQVWILHAISGNEDTALLIKAGIGQYGVFYFFLLGANIPKLFSFQ